MRARVQQDRCAAPRGQRLPSVAISPVDTLIARLERVRRSGRGWTARCPAHEDRTASLSITSGDDGRVLLHCFAGCSAADVVAAAGLEVADLFVRRPTESVTFAERAALREQARQSQWRAALNVMTLEAKIVYIAAREVAAGKQLPADDMDRLARAVALIDHAQGVLCGKSP